MNYKNILAFVATTLLATTPAPAAADLTNLITAKNLGFATVATSGITVFALGTAYTTDCKTNEQLKKDGFASFLKKFVTDSKIRAKILKKYPSVKLALVTSGLLGTATVGKFCSTFVVKKRADEQRAAQKNQQLQEAQAAEEQRFQAANRRAQEQEAAQALEKVNRITLEQLRRNQERQDAQAARERRTQEELTKIQEDAARRHQAWEETQTENDRRALAEQEQRIQEENRSKQEQQRRKQEAAAITEQKRLAAQAEINKKTQELEDAQKELELKHQQEEQEEQKRTIEQRQKQVELQKQERDKKRLQKGEQEEREGLEQLQTAEQEALEEKERQEKKRQEAREEERNFQEKQKAIRQENERITVAKMERMQKEQQDIRECQQNIELQKEQQKLAKAAAQKIKREAAQEILDAFEVLIQETDFILDLRHSEYTDEFDFHKFYTHPEYPNATIHINTTTHWACPKGLNIEYKINGLKKSKDEFLKEYKKPPVVWSDEGIDAYCEILRRSNT